MLFLVICTFMSGLNSVYPSTLSYYRAFILFFGTYSFVIDLNSITSTHHFFNLLLARVSKISATPAPVLALALKWVLSTERAYLPDYMSAHTPLRPQFGSICLASRTCSPQWEWECPWGGTSWVREPTAPFSWTSPRPWCRTQSTPLPISSQSYLQHFCSTLGSMRGISPDQPCPKWRIWWSSRPQWRPSPSNSHQSYSTAVRRTSSCSIELWSMFSQL